MYVGRWPKTNRWAYCLVCEHLENLYVFVAKDLKVLILAPSTLFYKDDNINVLACILKEKKLLVTHYPLQENCDLTYLCQLGGIQEVLSWQEAILFEVLLIIVVSVSRLHIKSNQLKAEATPQFTSMQYLSHLFISLIKVPWILTPKYNNNNNNCYANAQF